MICGKCGVKVTPQSAKHVNKNLAERIGIYNYKCECGSFLETHIDVFN